MSKATISPDNRAKLEREGLYSDPATGKANFTKSQVLKLIPEDFKKELKVNSKSKEADIVDDVLRVIQDKQLDINFCLSQLK